MRHFVLFSFDGRQLGVSTHILGLQANLVSSQVKINICIFVFVRMYGRTSASNIVKFDSVYETATNYFM